jgi:hypothetical protein
LLSEAQPKNAIVTPPPNLEMIASTATRWAFLPVLLAVIRQDVCKKSENDSISLH